MSESTGNCLEEMSSNLPTYTQVSGMRQLSNGYPFPANCDLVRTATTECSSHAAGSGKTVSNVPFSSMASFAPATNVKNECLNPCHSRLYSSLSMNVMKSNTSEINHHVIQHMGTNLIVPLHDFENGQRHWNLKDPIKSDPMYVYPHYPISSMWSSPVNFYGHRYACGMESLPYPINKNNNQSFVEEVWGATGIDHLSVEVLTPIASQVSRYYTDMISANVVSHSIKESSHHSNSSHYNPLAMREPWKRTVNYFHQTSNDPETLGIRL